jgi:hypothetical protein
LQADPIEKLDGCGSECAELVVADRVTGIGNRSNLDPAISLTHLIGEFGRNDCAERVIANYDKGGAGELFDY